MDNDGAGLTSVAPSPSVNMDDLEKQTAPPSEEPVEQPKVDPPAEQPKADTPDPIAALKAEYDKRLQDMQRELGQGRKMASEFAKLKQQLQNQPKQSVPTALDNLDPEQRKQVAELIKAVVSQEYGQKFADMDSYAEQMAQMQERNTFLSDIKQAVGENYGALEPIMAKLLDSAAEAAEAGNESAQKFLAKVKNAPELLAMYAEKEYSQTVAAKSEQAKTAQQAQAKKAATTLQSTPKAPTTQDLTPAQMKKLTTKELEALIPHELDM